MIRATTFGSELRSFEFVPEEFSMNGVSNGAIDAMREAHGQAIESLF